MLWPVSLITPIPAFDARPGKLYKLTAGGIITMPATTGSITLTPRWGQSATVATNISMGASTAQFSAVATTNRPWTMELHVLCRTVAAAGGANSTVIGWGDFKTQGIVTAGGATILICMGGTSATVDVGVATGIGVSIIWTTTAGSITTQFAVLQSLN